TARLTRHQFMRNFAIAQFIYIFGSVGLSILVAFGFGMLLYFHGYSSSEQLAILSPYIIAESWLFAAVAVAITIFAAIQRMHDLNKSGWDVLILLLPFVNFYVFYTLAMWDSHDSGNRYGQKQTTDVHRKKLVEILFVFAIVTMIAEK